MGSPIARSKPIDARLDDPPLPPRTLEFIFWAARYAVDFAGRPLAMSLRGLGAPRPAPQRRLVATDVRPDRMTPARQRVLEAAVMPMSAADLARAAGVSTGVLIPLAACGALVESWVDVGVPFPAPDADRAAAVLNPSQAAAAKALGDMIDTGDFAVALLDGVTGSGKTEVYLEAVAAALRYDRPTAQILVLLPEIALTAHDLRLHPPTPLSSSPVARCWRHALAAIFGRRMLPWRSNRSTACCQGDFREQNEYLRGGCGASRPSHRADTRSAPGNRPSVDSPGVDRFGAGLALRLPNGIPGVATGNEATGCGKRCRRVMVRGLSWASPRRSSCRSLLILLWWSSTRNTTGPSSREDGFIYHARDLAVARAKIEGCPVVLASATPSLETLWNAQSGRYQWLKLTDRHGAAVMPEVTFVDLRARTPPESGSWMAPVLADAVAQTLSNGEQSLLFLNRRGYAPLVLCRVCGEKLRAPDTDSWLVEHRYSGRLVCHLDRIFDSAAQALSQLPG